MRKEAAFLPVLYLVLLATSLSSLLVTISLIAAASTSKPVHNGFLNQQFKGTYHANYIDGEWVFTLNSDRSLLRLLFYCGFQNVTDSMWKKNVANNATHLNVQVNQYDHYCAQPSELPLKDGDLVQVRGTLIRPSQLSTEFIGDLYVFEYCVDDVCLQT